MRKMDIEALIEKYQITDAGDGTIAVHGQVSEQEVALLTQTKSQILEHFRLSRLRREAQDAYNTQVFQSIPGVTELCRADAKERADLARRYPEAAFALKVAQGRRDPNYEFAAISSKAYQLILSGQDIPSVQLRYEKDCDEYLWKIMWA